MVTIRFLNATQVRGCHYNTGERAAFSDEIAAALIQGGCAVPVASDAKHLTASPQDKQQKAAPRSKQATR